MAALINLPMLNFKITVKSSNLFLYKKNSSKPKV